MEKRNDINPLLELLRILAILALVLYHVSCLGEGTNKLEKLFLLITARGWIGTDIFLVIAGYLFYHSYYTKKKSIIYIIKRRIKRILPSYYLFLILYLSIGISIERRVGNPFAIQQGYWLYFLTFTANIAMAFGEWSGVALEGLFGISLLVQLYVIFIILFLINKQKRYRLYMLFLIELAVITIRFIPVLKNTEWFSYFFTLTRMDGFIFGIILAILRENQFSYKLLIEHRYKLLFSSGMLLIATVPITDYLAVENSLTSCLAFPAIGLFITVFLNSILSWHTTFPIFYAGDFTYSIYLAKLPLIYIIRQLLDGHTSENMFFSLFALCSVILCITWGLITHLINMQRKFFFMM